MQWIAATTMVVDHLGLYIFADTAMYEPLRIIGRLAMPLYVYMLTEGFQHTRNKDKYFWRILIFAFIAQLPIFILTWLCGLDWYLNAMFGLAAALIALSFAKRGGWNWLGVIAIALVTQICNVDYGATMVVLAVGFYLCSRRYMRTGDWLSCEFGYASVLLMGMLLAYFLSGWKIQIFGVAAIIPIMLYNGQKGLRMPRYFFYVFYPIHLVPIIALKLLL